MRADVNYAMRAALSTTGATRCRVGPDARKGAEASALDAANGSAGMLAGGVPATAAARSRRRLLTLLARSLLALSPAVPLLAVRTAIRLPRLDGAVAARMCALA